MAAATNANSAVTMAAAAAYSVEHQVRSICPFYQQNRPAGVHRFLLGTAACGSTDNKLYLVDYHEANRIADCVAVWSHEEEIWSMTASPCTTEALTLFSTYSPSEDSCRLMRVPEQSPAGDLGELQRLNGFPVGTRSVLWDAEGLQLEARTAGARDISVWKLEPFLSTSPSSSASGAAVASTRVVLPSDASSIERAMNDPHQAHIVGLVTRDRLWFVDTRDRKPIRVNTARPIHAGAGAKWLEYSGATMYKFLTCGADGNVALWDARAIVNPVASSSAAASAAPAASAAMKPQFAPTSVVNAHQHYCMGASFHPFHDQLILSWGSDHALRLWDTAAPTATAGTTSTVCSKTLTDFGESVYSGTWSCSGAWIYAGVSFHGKVLVDVVPNDIKMRILLSAKHGEDF